MFFSLIPPQNGFFSFPHIMRASNVCVCIGKNKNEKQKNNLMLYYLKHNHMIKYFLHYILLFGFWNGANVYVLNFIMFLFVYYIKYIWNTKIMFLLCMLPFIISSYFTLCLCYYVLGYIFFCYTYMVFFEHFLHFKVFMKIFNFIIL